MELALQPTVVRGRGTPSGVQIGARAKNKAPLKGAVLKMPFPSIFDLLKHPTEGVVCVPTSWTQNTLCKTVLSSAALL